MSLDRKNVSLVMENDEQSFETIFTRFYPLVYQLAYRCTGEQNEADDIAQEVFIRYYRVPPQATSEGERRAWLCRVATNLSLNVLRTQQRRTHHEDQVGKMRQQTMAGEEVQANPEQYVLAQEQAAFTRSVLAELPE